MVKQREVGYVMIIQEPALSRIKNGECPVCGKPKHKWTRRTDWRCCSCECTDKFEDCCIIRSWTRLRDKVFKRDKYTCVKCLQKHPSYNLIGDHIIPIALGGNQWDENNVQTLCISCDKIKTKEDASEIAKLRRIEKKLVKGQTQLKEVGIPPIDKSVGILPNEL